MLRQLGSDNFCGMKNRLLMDYFRLTKNVALNDISKHAKVG